MAQKTKSLPQMVREIKKELAAKKKADPEAYKKCPGKPKEKK